MYRTRKTGANPAAMGAAILIGIEPALNTNIVNSEASRAATIATQTVKQAQLQQYTVPRELLLTRYTSVFRRDGIERDFPCLAVFALAAHVDGDGRGCRFVTSTKAGLALLLLGIIELSGTSTEGIRRGGKKRTCLHT